MLLPLRAGFHGLKNSFFSSAEIRLQCKTSSSPNFSNGSPFSMLKSNYMHEEASLQNHLLEMSTPLPWPYLDDQNGDESSAAAHLPFGSKSSMRALRRELKSPGAQRSNVLLPHSTQNHVPGNKRVVKSYCFVSGLFGTALLAIREGMWSHPGVKAQPYLFLVGAVMHPDVEQQ